MSDYTRPWMRLNDPQLSLDDMHVGVVGAPYDGSVTHASGAAQAPRVLREISGDTAPHTEDFISLKGLRIRDLGDAPVDNENALATQEAITKTVLPIVEAGAIPLVLGGDHSITSAVVAAFSSRENLGVLWIDAHPDLMDTFKGIKGREESKWSHACPLRRICELPNIHPENVFLFGIREFIEDELQFIRQNNIDVIYSRDLYRMSLDTIVERIRQRFEGVPEIYISFDIDVLDPAYAPGTGVPTPGGISSRYLYDLLSLLLGGSRDHRDASPKPFPRVVGFDVVEIAPPHDVGRITSLAGIGIITTMLGRICIQEGLPDIDLWQS